MSDLLVRHGPKLAVGGLVVLNLVLLGALALRDPVRTAVPAAPVPASSTSATSAFARPRPTQLPTQVGRTFDHTHPVPLAARPREPPLREAGAPSRLLAANSGRVAWRATSTDCKGKAVVEVTTNGGRSWSKTNPGLTAIVRLKAYGDSSVFAIGADTSADPMYAWINGPKQEVAS